MQSFEPALSTLLADPLIRTLMRADRVDPIALEAMLTEVSATLDTASLRPADMSAACSC